jgi:hypothetical protein
LKREERIEQLEKEARRTKDDSVFGLPKVAVLRIKKRAKDKKKKEEEVVVATEEVKDAKYTKDTKETKEKKK